MENALSINGVLIGKAPINGSVDRKIPNKMKGLDRKINENHLFQWSMASSQPCLTGRITKQPILEAHTIWLFNIAMENPL